MTAARKPAGKLNSIQILRAIAALLVVWHHSIRAYSVNTPHFMAGLPPSHFAAAWFRDGLAAGVDIFFAISGFIMVYGAGRFASGQQPAIEFLRRRVERIYPPYWAATAILIAFIFLKTRGRSPDLGSWRIFDSALLFPQFDAQGTLQPILGVGWTLSYEMYFYILFFIALALAKGRYLILLAAMLVGFWAVAAVASSPTAVGVFLANTVVLEFLFGCAIGMLFLRGKLPKSLPWLAPVAVVAIFAASYFQSTGAVSDFWRPIVWGIPAALLVCAAVTIRFEPRTWAGRTAVFLGDASYSIYLTHVIVIYYVMPRFQPKFIAWGIVRHTDMAVLVAFVASTLAGCAFYVLVERPTLRWLGRKSKRPVPAVSAG
jgi:peptidoglycan/LPS O-acetylase OafA/YrhL